MKAKARRLGLIQAGDRPGERAGRLREPRIRRVGEKQVSKESDKGGGERRCGPTGPERAGVRAERTQAKITYKKGRRKVKKGRAASGTSAR